MSFVYKYHKEMLNGKGVHMPNILFWSLYNVCIYKSIALDPIYI